MDCSPQAPLFMRFPRQEYWSGLSCPSGDLPHPGIKPLSLVSTALAGGFFTAMPLGKPYVILKIMAKYVFTIKHRIDSHIILEYSLEGRMMKLKLQYFGRLMRRADSLEKTLMLGKVEGRRRG